MFTIRGGIMKDYGEKILNLLIAIPLLPIAIMYILLGKDFEESPP